MRTATCLAELALTVEAGASLLTPAPFKLVVWIVVTVVAAIAAGVLAGDKL